MLNFPNLIYQTLQDDNLQRKPGGHNPSSASFKYPDGKLIGTDLLTQWLKWREVPYSNAPDGAALFKMRMGDSAHYAISSVLKRNKSLKVLAEQDASFVVGNSKLLPGLTFPITYRLDCLVNDGNELGIVEVKSTMQQVMYSPGWGLKFTGPKVEHLLQCISYIELAPMVKYVSLVYVDRGSGGMLQFNIEKKGKGYTVDGKPVQDITWEGITSRWKELEVYLKSNEQPPIERSVWINDKTGEVMDVKTIGGQKFKSDWEWLYSSYRDYVWKNPTNFQYTFNAKHNQPV